MARMSAQPVPGGGEAVVLPSLQGRPDETPFRLDNLRDLGLRRVGTGPACSPAPPEPYFSWNRVIAASQARVGSPAAVEVDRQEPSTSVSGHVLLSPLLDAAASRRARRLALAAAGTIVAALATVAMLLGLLLLEPGLGRGEAPTLSEELVLSSQGPTGRAR